MIEVELPDGTVAEFPDGTSPDVIKGALQKRFAAQRGHNVPEYVPPGVEGYNPETGMVEPPASSRPSTFLGGFTEGLPIAGPVLREGQISASAGLGSLMTGEPYSEVRDEIALMRDKGDEQFPGTHTAGNITGAVTGTVPMVLAAPQLMGAGGGNLLTRSLYSGGSGAVIGGADADIRSDGRVGGDPEAVKRGFLLGAGTGLAAPGAADLIGKGVRSGADYLLNSSVARNIKKSPEAVKALVRAMGRDAVDPSDLPGRLGSMGDEAMIADLGPNLRIQAGSIAATPGRGQEVVRSAMGARDAGATTRIRGTLDDTLGKAKTPGQVTEALDAKRAVLSPQYEAVLKNAKRVDTQPVADWLESANTRLRGPAQSAVKNVRGMLNVTGADELDPNPRTLHEVRQAIDGMMSSETNGKVIATLAEARQQIDDVLQKSIPGIKEVDAQWAELARQGDAFETGRQVLDSGRTSPPPEDLARAIEQGVQPQGRMVGPSGAPNMMREGTRTEIERLLGTKINDRVALKNIVKGEGDWNRARLESLFGKDKTDKVIKLLENESAFAEVSNDVTRNSLTAARQAGQADLPGMAGSGNIGMRDAYVVGGTPGATRQAVLRALEKAGESLKGLKSEKDVADLGELLTLRQRDAVVRELMRLNGGRAVPQAQINTAIRSALQAPAIATNVQ